MTFDRAVSVQAQLRRSQRAAQARALALISPLLVLILFAFALPIGLMLFRSIENTEVNQALPSVGAALQEWEGRELPGEAAFFVLARALADAYRNKSLAGAARRINGELPGARSLLMNSGRAFSKALPATPAEAKQAFLDSHPDWGKHETWVLMKRATAPLTASHLLASMDRGVDLQGHIVKLPEEEAVNINLFGRTLWMSFVVTVLCLLLGFPVAHWLANARPAVSNVLMMLVLLPFWTSLLVRTSAWFVVLQKHGLVNQALAWLGVLSEPMQLVFNRTGVYISMVHILLPFMILPLYSVMKSIPPVYMRAAASLGAPPVTAFFKVYLPQTLPGIGAGGLLVFILAVGYYVTPALMGGPEDQMISYFIAFYTNQTLNWGLASALGAVLLVITLALATVYQKLVGAKGLRFG
jgi:putative spermidine/putrescine transport system permease protein